MLVDAGSDVSDGVRFGAGVVMAGDEGHAPGSEVVQELGVRSDAAPLLARGRGADEADRGLEAAEDQLDEVVRNVVHRR